MRNSILHNLLGFLTVICVFTSLGLFLFWWNDLSQLQTVWVTTFAFLSGLGGIGWLYATAKAIWLKEPDPQLRLDRLGNVNKQFIKILLVYISFFLVVVAIGVWQLFMGDKGVSLVE